MSSTTLTKSLSAGQWAFLNTIVQRVLVFGTLFIVARLLTPADFGVAALISIIPTFLDGSTSFAFDTAALQNGNIERYLNVIWTFTVLRGLCIFLIVYLVAPAAATFFHIPYALTLLRLAALGVLVQSFANVGQTYFFQDMDFRRVFLRDLTLNVTCALATIVFAFFIRSYWALFLGNIVSFVCVVAATYVLHPYRPKFDFHLGLLGELRSFTQWLFAQEISQQLSLTIQNSVIGRFTTPASLGIFNKAQSLSDAPIAPLSSTISKVSLMSYISIQNSRVHIIEGVTKTFEIMTFIALPYLTLILLSATSIVHILLGSQWLSMAPYLKILTIEATLDVLINSLSAPAFNAIGESRVQFVNSGIRALTLIVAMVVLVPLFGIWGAVFAALVSVMLTACVVLFQLLTTLHLRLGRLMLTTVMVSLACVPPTVLAFSLLTVPFFNTLPGFVFMAFLCGTLYIATTIFIGRTFRCGPYKTLELVARSFLKSSSSRSLDFLFLYSEVEGSAS